MYPKFVILGLGIRPTLPLHPRCHGYHPPPGKPNQIAQVGSVLHFGHFSLSCLMSIIGYLLCAGHHTQLRTLRDKEILTLSRDGCHERVVSGHGRDAAHVSLWQV